MSNPDRHPQPSLPPLPEADEVFQRLDLCRQYPYTFREYVGRFTWLFVQSTIMRFSPPRAFGWRRFWLRLFGAAVHPTSCLGRTVHVFHPWLLTTGEHCRIGNGAQIYNLARVTIGRHSVVSQHAVLCAGTHDYSRPDMPLVRKPVMIGSGVWVCAYAFIGPGVTVGNNAVVGARAVAMRDVPAGMVVAGNPAVIVKPRPRASAAGE